MGCRLERMGEAKMDEEELASGCVWLAKNDDMVWTDRSW